MRYFLICLSALLVALSGPKDLRWSGAILDTYADIALAGFGDALATAKALEAYDQMIAEGNADGNAVVQAAIDAPIARTRGIERAVALLKLEGVSIEQSDSLTSPDAVFQ